MKKWAICVTLFFFGILLSACSGKGQGQSLASEENLKVCVLSTTGMIDDIVAQIGGDRIDHRVLISGEIDPHHYELVKGDDEKIDGAAIVFYNGLNLEHGASLRNKLAKHPKSIAVGDYVAEKNPEWILRVDREIDPHIWMDISMWVYIVDPILEALIEVDPEGQDYFELRASVVRQQMNQVHQRILERIQEVPIEKRYLVTSHDAFGYFARRYLSTEEERQEGSWVKRFAAPEGLAPDGQLSAMDIQNIIDHLCKYEISIVFSESNVSRDSLKKIVDACYAKQKKVRFSTEPLYGDSMGGKGTAEGSYLGMIEHNVTTIIKEWSS